MLTFSDLDTEKPLANKVEDYLGKIFESIRDFRQKEMVTQNRN